MTALTDSERGDFLADHQEWTLEGESITRTFVFADFIEAIGFVARVAMASEVADHHPDIDIRWNKVTLTLSTHEEGALTSKDTELAAVFDGFGRG
jgi:4a-hydroxytetrahydrobiopterin dehydratase